MQLLKMIPSLISLLEVLREQMELHTLDAAF